MRVLQLHRGATFGFCLFLFAVSCCYGKDETVEVVGFVEHTDFAQSKIKTSQTFSAFYVTIGCKSADGKLKTMGSGELDEGEKFEVILPQEIIKDGVIKEECYAQLHNASDSPCPLHNSQEALKITFQYTAKGKRTISQTGKLNFSPITCTSKFLWHFHMFPPLHKWWPPLVGTPFQYPPTPPYHAIPPPPRIPPSPPTTSQPTIPAPENSLPPYKQPLPPPPVYNKWLPPTIPPSFPPPPYKKFIPPTLGPPSPVSQELPPTPPPVPESKTPPPSPTPVTYNPIPPPTPVAYKPIPPPTPVTYNPIPPPTPVAFNPIPPPTPGAYKPIPPAAAPTLENPAPPGPVSKQPQPPPTAAARPYKKLNPPHIPTFIIPKPPPIPTFKNPTPPPIPALN